MMTHTDYKDLIDCPVPISFNFLICCKMSLLNEFSLLKINNVDLNDFVDLLDDPVVSAGASHFCCFIKCTNYWMVFHNQVVNEAVGISSSS